MTIARSIRERAARLQKAPAPADEDGFTLLEVLVATVILTAVVLGFLGLRTDALMDSMEARNWRLARELAEEKLSQLQAGALEVPPEPGRYPSQRYEGFDVEVVIGEDRIADWESSNAGGTGITDSNDRRLWQRERDNMRLARQKGMTIEEYRDQQLRDEIDEQDKDKVPSEDDLEDVLVVVYFPDKSYLRKGKGGEGGNPDAMFKLKAKISTLALQGMTPDEAQSLANAKGEATASPTATATPGSNQ